MRVRTRLRPGVYWDEHNVERRCLVLELQERGEWRRVGVLDRSTREPIVDPPAAITIDLQDV